MICQLCLGDFRKLCKAHLVPESFVRFMYPNSKVEGESLLLIEGDQNFVKRRRVGMYDNSILCEECDKKIGREYDEYGKKIFLDSVPVTKLVISKLNRSATCFENADIEKLKIFILSVFWRLAISKIDDTKDVNLPDKYTKRLRDIIWNSDAGDVNDLSVIITKFQYKNPDKGLNKFFRVPKRTRTSNGINGWTLYIPNGFKMFIKVDQRKLEGALLEVALSVGRPAYILNYEEFEESEEYKSFLDNVRKVNL